MAATPNATCTGPPPPDQRENLRMPSLAINGRFLSQPITGVQRVARELIQALDNILGASPGRVRARIYCPKGYAAQASHLAHIEAVEIGMLKGPGWEQLELPIHVHEDVLLCLGNSAPCLRLAAGLKTAVVIHDLSYLQFPRAYRFGYRLAHRMMLPFILRRTDRIFLVSRTECDSLLRIAPFVGNKVEVAPNGSWSFVKHNEVLGGNGLPPGYALYVGSFSSRKNFERIVAAATVLAREDRVPFVFAGSTGKVLRPPAIEIPEDVRHLIHFVGHVSQLDELASLYTRARLLLFPSLYEACPMPPFEAAQFDCPVAASNIPSMWERCGEGVTYCDPYSVDSIVAAARTVLRGGPEIERRVAINRAAADRASWSRQAETILASVLELCRSSRSSESLATLGRTAPR